MNNDTQSITLTQIDIARAELKTVLKKIRKMKFIPADLFLIVYLEQVEKFLGVTNDQR